ncbi:relaxase/mobilization nuclease domain-containing protein, partial [Klebsiella pneumoniae]
LWVAFPVGTGARRRGAACLEGKPASVRVLISASRDAIRYTSGVLSFVEAELLPGPREQSMASFERVLMPGRDKDQYSILWVEHTDKGRLDLNFLFPNTELPTGKRLQPYDVPAYRQSIPAWPTVAHGRLGMHDLNTPENMRVVDPTADLY